MRIKKFNESSIDEFLAKVDDQREWLKDFLEDLEIDFPGTKCSLDRGRSPQISELDVLVIKITNKSSDIPVPNCTQVSTDDDLGWSRRNLFKYIEDKISFLTNTIDDLSCVRCILYELTGSKPIYASNLDISSPRFWGRYKKRLLRVTEIRIPISHGDYYP